MVIGLTQPQNVQRQEPVNQRDARQLLFIHGWWGGPWVWEYFLPFFSGQGFGCHVLDLRARGQGCDRNSFYTHLEAVQTAVRQLDHPILIGHSAGGLLAAKIAESESVAAVIALAPAVPKGVNVFNPQLLLRSPRYLLSALTQRGWIFNQTDMAALNLNCLPEVVQRQVYAKMVPIDPQQLWDIVIWGVSVQTALVRGPQLIIAGLEDALTPVNALKATAKRYRADFYTYPHHAHYLMYEPGWEQIAADILQWLQAKVSTGV